MSAIGIQQLFREERFVHINIYLYDKGFLLFIVSGENGNSKSRRPIWTFLCRFFSINVPLSITTFCGI